MRWDIPHFDATIRVAWTLKAIRRLAATLAGFHWCLAVLERRQSLSVRQKYLKLHTARGTAMAAAAMTAKAMAKSFIVEKGRSRGYMVPDK
jgi:hypothetical protein